MKTNFLRHFSMLCIVIIAFSCRSSKDMVYLQNVGTPDGQELATSVPVKYTLRPGDNLYVKVSSLDKQINDMFTGGANNSNAGSVNEMGLYINSFTVNENGFVMIPVLGEISVQGLTVEETQKAFTKRCDEFLKNSVVVVKLTSFRFSIIGEVYRPGTYLITRENFNIFEAISQGGDLKDYANRTDIRIIRKSDNGKKIFTIDLTKDDVFMSKAFYLQADDIIYVRQDKFKDYKLNVPTFTLILSTISSVLLILNFLK